MPPRAFDDVGELVEVQRDGVLNRYPEVLLNGRHQLGQALVEPRIDLVGPGGARVGDEQVARDGEQRQPVMGRVGMEDHDHIAVDPVDALRAQPESRVLHGQRAPGGRADHQDVLRAGLLAGCEGGVKALHLDPVEVVGEVVGEPRTRHHHNEHHRQRDQAAPTEQALATTPCRRPAAPTGTSPHRAMHVLAEGGQPGLVGHPAGARIAAPTRSHVLARCRRRLHLLAKLAEALFVRRRTAPGWRGRRAGR